MCGVSTLFKSVLAAPMLAVVLLLLVPACKGHTGERSLDYRLRNAGERSLVRRSTDVSEDAKVGEHVLLANDEVVAGTRPSHMRSEQAHGKPDHLVASTVSRGESDASGSIIQPGEGGPSDPAGVAAFLFTDGGEYAFLTPWNHFVTHYGILGSLIAKEREVFSASLTNMDMKPAKLDAEPSANFLPKIIGGLVATAIVGALLIRTAALSLSAVVIVFYVAISVCIDLTISMQTQKGSAESYAFNPACAVVLTEAIKFCLSCVLYAAAAVNTKSDGSEAITVTSAWKWEDATWLSLPAMLYAANNMLVFKAIGMNDVASFGVFRDTVILWTASIRWMVYRTPLGNIRLFGMFVIVVGLVLNRISTLFAGHFWSVAILWVVFMTLTNASGAVANEYALKKNYNLDINVQNAMLYAFCAGFAVLYLLVDDPGTLLKGNFFKGFTRYTLLLIALQSFAGLLVSRLLKYADAVTKNVASCLRGPTLVLVAPYFVSSPNSSAVIVYALIVASGAFIFLSQGPLKA